MLQLAGVRFSGPLESYARGFAAELKRLGYTSNSLKAQLFVVAHLSRWLVERRLGVEGLTPTVVEEFFAERRRVGYTNYRTPRTLDPLLRYLGGLGVAAAPAPVVVPSPVEALLARFSGYLTDERGLKAGTARGYVDAVRRFVAGWETEDGLDLAQLTAGEVTAFVVAVCPTQPRGSARMTVSALRSLLGWLHLEGVLSESLVAAVPSVASWRLAGLPTGLQPDEVVRLLGSCDRRTVIGRRDFAILTVLVRLGLRAGEVAGLRLEDIDWRSGELVVRGKGGRHDRLPLPVDVGDAIVAYLRHRPATAQDRAVFLRVRAPHRGLTVEGITGAVFSAGRRAGLDQPVRAHRLRHTTATGLLAAGASLGEVGQLLGHRRQLTTAIYAKVDHGRLSTIARAWPGGER